jgi:hypothetical protein
VYLGWADHGRKGDIYTLHAAFFAPTTHQTVPISHKA